MILAYLQLLVLNAIVNDQLQKKDLQYRFY